MQGGMQTSSLGWAVEGNNNNKQRKVSLDPDLVDARLYTRRNAWLPRLLRSHAPCNLHFCGQEAEEEGSGGMAEGSPASQDSRNSDEAERDQQGGGSVREQDRFMPIANVIRIMRKVLPAHAKISDDAKETIQECVSEFISFITSEANDKCQREQRKTITAEDVLWAMSKLGFDDYVEPLTLFLHKYREVEGDHRGSIRGEPLGLAALPKKISSSSSSAASVASPSAAAVSSDHVSSPMLSYATTAAGHGGMRFYKDSLTGATLPFVPGDAYASYK